MCVMWDVWDVGCLKCGMLDVGCLLGCGMLVYQMPSFIAVKVFKDLHYKDLHYLHFYNLLTFLFISVKHFEESGNNF